MRATIAALFALLAAATPAHADVFATTGSEHSPEGVVTIGKTTFVSTTPPAPAILTGSGEPSVIYRFDRRTGAERGRIVVAGETLRGSLQGIAGLTKDPQGRLLANDAQGRVLRFTRRARGGFRQETYATVPDVGPCTLVSTSPCSAHPLDLQPVVNEITRLPDGTLLLSDSFQAAVWRVPPGGGEASLLVTDARLIGTAFGPNGIAGSPDGREAILAVSSDPNGNGVLYRFTVAAPTLRAIATYAPGQFPDGIQWVAEDRLYVAQSTARAVTLVDPRTGAERARFEDPSLTAPAGIEVDERRGEALLANHDVDMFPPGPGTVSRVAVSGPGTR